MSTKKDAKDPLVGKQRPSQKWQLKQQQKRIASEVFSVANFQAKPSERVFLTVRHCLVLLRCTKRRRRGCGFVLVCGDYFGVLGGTSSCLYLDECMHGFLRLVPVLIKSDKLKSKNTVRCWFPRHYTWTKNLVGKGWWKATTVAVHFYTGWSRRQCKLLELVVL